MTRQLLVNQILPFSNVDGEGNRCSIFVQGCQLNCLYCHNSETIHVCNHCGECVKVCSTGALNMVKQEVMYSSQKCLHCDDCIRSCPYQSSPKAKYHDIDTLVELILEYKPYIRGITISGGEPTLYHEAIIELFQKVKPHGLTCYVDTNGFFDKNEMENLIEVTDGFLFDVKSVENLEVLCGISGDQHLDNLKYLLKMDKIIEVRTVLLNDFMNQKKTLAFVGQLLLEFPGVPYKLIRAHLTGLKEYQKDVIAQSILTTLELETLGDYLKGLGFGNIKLIR